MLIVTFALLLCCCGVDTENMAGSASQVSQTEASAEEDIDVDFEEDAVTEAAEDVDESYEEDFDTEEDFDEEVADEEAAEEDLEEESSDSDEPVFEYVLNTNTGKFHYPSCRSVKQMKDKNKLFVEATRDEIIGRGYSPCGNCNP